MYLIKFLSIVRNQINVRHSVLKILLTLSQIIRNVPETKKANSISSTFQFHCSNYTLGAENFPSS